MIKRLKSRRFARCFAAVLLFLLFATFGGCAPQNEDFFAPLRQKGEAGFKGSFNGVPIEGKMEFTAISSEDAESGAPRAVTITLYAPASLAGTTLSRGADGTVTLSSGDIAVTGDSANAFLPLLSALPVAGHVTDVQKTEGNTCVMGDGFSLTFAPDGSLVAITNGPLALAVSDFVTE